MQCVTNIEILWFLHVNSNSFSGIELLAQQGLAIHGHEKNEGNLLQFLRLCSADEPYMLQWLKDGKYLSPDILNEIIKLMADNVLWGYW